MQEFLMGVAAGLVLFGVFLYCNRRYIKRKEAAEAIKARVGLVGKDYL